MHPDRRRMGARRMTGQAGRHKACQTSSSAQQSPLHSADAALGGEPHKDDEARTRRDGLDSPLPHLPVLTVAPRIRPVELPGLEGVGVCHTGVERRDPGAADEQLEALPAALPDGHGVHVRAAVPPHRLRAPVAPRARDEQPEWGGPPCRPLLRRRLCARLPMRHATGGWLRPCPAAVVAARAPGAVWLLARGADPELPPAACGRRLQRACAPAAVAADLPQRLGSSHTVHTQSWSPWGGAWPCTLTRSHLLPQASSGTPHTTARFSFRPRSFAKGLGPARRKACRCTTVQAWILSAHGSVPWVLQRGSAAAESPTEDGATCRPR
mmetsp:Transcript_101763/g.314071  ORF Transcript_101763/g.314071 Transcript_101763/m.314071 type:complete len:325 (+) Transcript_101763:204-1178(+)